MGWLNFFLRNLLLIRYFSCKFFIRVSFFPFSLNNPISLNLVDISYPLCIYILFLVNFFLFNFLPSFIRTSNTEEIIFLIQIFALLFCCNLLWIYYYQYFFTFSFPRKKEKQEKNSQLYTSQDFNTLYKTSCLSAANHTVF